MQFSGTAYYASLSNWIAATVLPVLWWILQSKWSRVNWIFPYKRILEYSLGVVLQSVKISDPDGCGNC